MSQDKDIDKIVSSYKPPFKKTKDEAWNEMISKIESGSEPITSKLIILNKKFYYVAASLLIFLAITWFVADNSYKTFYVENGAKKEVILPDNSVVLINSDSHLSYSKLIWNFKRKIELDGEAYFKVKSGKEFIVITPIAQVQVLGTEFNTYSRKGVFETKCFSGKVQVKNIENEIVLTK
ncbi:MAG: FecR domain-containing protein, partial [Bacteroidales bacterium]|nr:FecR domain-containing protein [Bacteroidales bacterium]